MKRFVLLVTLLILLTGTRVAHSSPPCVPFMYGPVAKVPAAQWSYDLLGRHVYYACTNIDNSVTIYHYACRHDSGCSDAAFSAAGALVASSIDKRQAFDAIEREKVTRVDQASLDPSSPLAQLWVEHMVGYKAYVAAIPSTVVVRDTTAARWTVKSTGTPSSTTRSARLLVNGVLGNTQVALAPVGAVCDVTKPTKIAGAFLYAEFGAGPGIVAVCVKDSE